MPVRRASARPPRARAGLHVRLVATVTVLVIGCGGFLAYRSVAAIDDAYRWTAEAEAATVARGFAQTLGPRDLRDVARLRARAARLSGLCRPRAGHAGRAKGRCFCRYRGA